MTATILNSSLKTFLDREAIPKWSDHASGSPDGGRGLGAYWEVGRTCQAAAAAAFSEREGATSTWINSAAEISCGKIAMQKV